VSQARCDCRASSTIQNRDTETLRSSAIATSTDVVLLQACWPVQVAHRDGAGRRLLSSACYVVRLRSSCRFGFPLLFDRGSRCAFTRVLVREECPGGKTQTGDYVRITAWRGEQELILRTSSGTDTPHSGASDDRFLFRFAEIGRDSIRRLVSARRSFSSTSLQSNQIAFSWCSALTVADAFDCDRQFLACSVANRVLGRAGSFSWIVLRIASMPRPAVSCVERRARPATRKAYSQAVDVAARVYVQAGQNGLLGLIMPGCDERFNCVKRVLSSAAFVAFAIRNQSPWHGHASLIVTGCSRLDVQVDIPLMRVLDGWQPGRTNEPVRVWKRSFGHNTP